MPETTHERIDRIQRECAASGWYDGRGGEGIRPETAALTHRVADLFPGQHVGPGVEGELEFEWNGDGGTYIVTVLFLPDEPKRD